MGFISKLYLVCNLCKFLFCGILILRVNSIKFSLFLFLATIRCIRRSFFAFCGRVRRCSYWALKKYLIYFATNVWHIELFLAGHAGFVQGKQCTYELDFSLRHKLHVFGFSIVFHFRKTKKWAAMEKNEVFFGFPTRHMRVCCGVLRERATHARLRCF